MRIEWWTSVVVGVVVLSGVIARAEPEDRCQRVGLPANIQVSRALEQVLERVYARSASFRAQCARIAQAENLDIDIRTEINMPTACRAFTKFVRRGRHIRAAVHLPPSNMTLAELIGHEFEHVLEQLDAIDLPALADVRNSGVRRTAADIYETTRAQHAGRLVADEVRIKHAAD